MLSLYVFFLFANASSLSALHFSGGTCPIEVATLLCTVFVTTEEAAAFGIGTSTGNDQELLFLLPVMSLQDDC